MYQKILVPVDGSPTSILGLQEAIKIAKTLGATLRVVFVVNEFLMDPGYVPSLYYGGLIESLREAGKKVIDDVEAIVSKASVPFETALIETVGGRVCDLIVNQAQQWSAELIVMGTHGRRGLRRVALGSDAEMVLRTAPVPVLFVRSQAEVI
jgi:nucleotide-binding universal stress UspA family protein